VIGFVNGFGTAKIGLPAMIVTLCVSNVVTRLQYVFTNGKPTGTASALFTKTMQFRVFSVFPTSILYGVVIFLIVVYLLNRTNFGQQLFLAGNNDRAAFLTGIGTVRVRILTYTISGMLSGIAGMLGAGYMNFVQCQAFDSYTLNSIVAVVVGGTLLVGGKGSYIGTAAGSLLMIVLSNFLAVLDMPQAMRDLITGIVLIILLAAYNREKPVRQ
jgi:ribose transport system permease protein